MADIVLGVAAAVPGETPDLPVNDMIWVRSFTALGVDVPDEAAGTPHPTTGQLWPRGA